MAILDATHWTRSPAILTESYPASLLCHIGEKASVKIAESKTAFRKEVAESDSDAISKSGLRHFMWSLLSLAIELESCVLVLERK